MSTTYPDPNEAREQVAAQETDSAAAYEAGPQPSVPTAPPPAVYTGAEQEHGHRRRRRRRRSSRGMTQPGKREGRRITSQPWFIITSFVLALGFAAWLTYFMWNLEQQPRRVTAPSSAGGYEPANTIDTQERREAARMVGAAFRKKSEGDFFKAYEQFKNISQLYPSVPGVLWEIGRLGLRLGMEKDADQVLLEAGKRGGRHGEAELLLARDAARLGQAERMFDRYEAAHLADPANPRVLHLWGDALRGAGKNREAAEKYRESLERADSRSQAWVTGVKLRLAELEAGPESGRRAAVEAVEGGDADGAAYLLAAAAAALEAAAGGQADAEQARAFLREARDKIPGPIFDYLIRDPLFQSADAADLFGEMARVKPVRPGSPEDHLFP